MTTTLVTGGAGFIGSHFVERLLRDTSDSIVCLDNFNDYYPPARKRANVAGFAVHSRVSVIEADFCDALAIERLFGSRHIDRVVHLGGYAGVRNSVEAPLIYQTANVVGTAVLLEAVRRCPVERFVLVSSSTVYGRGATPPFIEDGPLGVPASPYGASKRSAELLGETYHALHGVPVVALRLFSVFGPRLRPDLALSVFTQKLLAGEPLPLFGDGSYRRDFTHVSDICSGILAALTVTEAVGEAINLGHDEPHAMREVIALLEAATGRKAVLDIRPAAASDLAVTHADLSKARRLLNYQPRVPLDEGIREFVEWVMTAVATHCNPSANPQH